VPGVVFRSERPSPRDARAARRALLGWARAEALPDHVVEALVLVVSELATNAVRHAGTVFEMTIEHVDGVVDLRVFDADSRLPMLAGTDDDATSGRGMQIVAAVSTEWGAGTEERDGISGKVVWARFELSGD
jgi:anti-sigma regulatory factor (Ser/Thr protein kinase)